MCLAKSKYRNGPLRIHSSAGWQATKSTPVKNALSNRHNPCAFSGCEMRGLFSSVPFLGHLFKAFPSPTGPPFLLQNDQLNERNNKHEEANLYHVVTGFVPGAL
jgi:hypothetical protein